MKIPKSFFLGRLLLFAVLFISVNLFSASVVTGNMKLWHPVTVTIDGPSVDESETTFRNYRLDVTFTKGTKSFKVPGFFAADGNAGETSATSGNKWRAIFTPNEIGTWNYSVSLRTGADIAISFVATVGTPTTGDGESGSFSIIPSDPDEKGFFAKGKLNYVGEHYGQFAGNNEWYVKAGPGSPEDFFGYKDFDNTVDGPLHNTTTQKSDVFLSNLNGEALHFFTPHVNDWKTGDPTWKSGKGKGIIGALNYLASIGANALYMIPFTINDDSDNTWPWTSRTAQMSYDVSKLAQWDIVFSHMDKIGIAPLYYLCESDNALLLDNANMTLKNPIYYREVIARFGYHLGMRFNLGEELKHTAAQQKTASTYLKNLDPYNIIVCGHGSHVRSTQLSIYNAMLGHADYDGPNYQLHEADSRDHLDLVMWRTNSAANGHKWIVANDESYQIDNSTTTKGEPRMLTYAWRTFMAGAEGMVQYTGYDMPVIADITLENFRDIENTQKILIAAKNLFQKPEINPLLPQMKNENALIGNPTGNDAPFCLAKKGEIYVVYRTSASNQKALNLTGETGTFTVKWYDAKNGGNLVDGTITSVPGGGGSVNLGNPPSNITGPWAVLVYKNACTNTKNISVSANGCTGSSASGGGSYCVGNSASVTAVQATNCKFVKWTENDIEVSTANPYTFVVSADRNLVANFIVEIPTTYNISTTASPSSSGTTTGNGTYNKDASVSVSATATSCSKFDNWTEDGNVVSTANPYVFTATKDRNLVGNFSTKEFNVIIEPLGGGTLSDLTFRCGDEFISTASPAIDYKFDGWYNGTVLLTTDPSIVINVGDGMPLKAKFSSLNPNVTLIGSWVKGTTHVKESGSLVLMLYGEGSGNISASKVTYGGQTMTKVVEKAFLSGAYSYTGAFILNEAGVAAATSGTIAVTWSVAPSSGSDVTSAFFSNVNQSTLTGATASNGIAGTTITTSALATSAGDMVLVGGTGANNGTYTINNGFTRGIAETSATFGDITSAYKLASGSAEIPSLTISASMRQTIVGFVLKKASGTSPVYYTLTTSATNGTVNPTGGSYLAGTSVSLVPTPDAGYKFSSWSGDLTGSSNPGTIQMDGDKNVTANFEIDNGTPPSPVTALSGWISGNTNNKVAGSNRLMTVMVMGEHATSDFSATSVTYGGQPMTKVTEKVLGTTYRTYAAIFTLKESGVNAATSGAINVTWSTTPGGFNVYSALLGNVDQTTPVSAIANNALTGTSISTTAMSAASGDMVILCGSTGSNTVVTFNNGFTKRLESNAGWGDGVCGEKMGADASETPKFTQSASGRMVICAIVAKKSASAMNAPRYATAVDANSSRNTISIYPNPTSDILNIDFPTTEVTREIRVFNTVGQMLYSVQTKNSTAQINVQALHLKGVVMVQVIDGTTVTNHRVVVK